MKKTWMKIMSHITYKHKIVILREGFVKNTKFKIIANNTNHKNFYQNNGICNKNLRVLTHIIHHFKSKACHHTTL